MSLLEPPPDTSSKSRPMVFAAVAIILIVAVISWWTFRFYPEKRTAEHFFDAVVAGDMDTAYKLWKAGPSYKMQDFLADWGPTGYYGPVKSYRVIREASPLGSNAVEITVAISPFSPIPYPSDAEKSQKTRVVAVWVITRDKALSFPP